MQIQSFEINVSQPILDDLQKRLARTRWTVLARGGHFAAMEFPELMAQDIRELFRLLR